MRITKNINVGIDTDQRRLEAELQRRAVNDRVAEQSLQCHMCDKSGCLCRDCEKMTYCGRCSERECVRNGKKASNSVFC